MNDRIEKELALLRSSYSKVTYVDSGQWVLIEDYPMPPGLAWNCQQTNVCFQIPPSYPGTPPYGFYVPAGILYEGVPPKKEKGYTEPAGNSPPFPGTWGFFSWQHETGWQATSDLQTGSNLLNFVRTFKDRFLEGN